MMGHWHRLPRAVTMAPSWPEFKKRLDTAFRHIVWFWGSPLQTQELNSMILVGPFQLGIHANTHISHIVVAKTSQHNVLEA